MIHVLVNCDVKNTLIFLHLLSSQLILLKLSFFPKISVAVSVCLLCEEQVSFGAEDAEDSQM